MDPDKSLAYMAASIRRSIDDYKTIAGMDISRNPGITATLYNTGGSDAARRGLGCPRRPAGGELLRLAGQRQARRVEISPLTADTPSIGNP
jgi:hypothetical protein